MAQRRSVTSDQCPVRLKKARFSDSGDMNKKLSTQLDNDCADNFDHARVDEHDSMKCDNLQEKNWAKHQSPVKQVVDYMSPPPCSLKRMHKPNTVYANDFVFSSTTKKSRLQKSDAASDLKQTLSSTNGIKKFMLETKLAGSNTKKSDHVSIVKKKNSLKKLQSSSDLTSSTGSSCHQQKQGRKPKHDNDSSVTEVASAKPGSLSKLNLSPRGAHAEFGGKNGRGRKPKLLNTSLPDEQLKINHDSSSNKTKVLSAVLKKNQRTCGEILSVVHKQDAERNHNECSLAQNRNTKSENLLSRSCQDRILSFKNAGLRDAHLKRDSELLSSGPGKRGKAQRKLVQETSEKDKEYCESSLTENRNVNAEKVMCSHGLSQRGRASDLVNTSFSDGQIKIESGSSVENEVVLTVQGKPPKKLLVNINLDVRYFRLYHLLPMISVAVCLSVSLSRGRLFGNCLPDGTIAALTTLM